MSIEKGLIIKDFKSIFWLVIACVFISLMLIGNSQDIGVILMGVGVVVILILIMKIRVEFGGVNVDIVNDKITFPGGGVTFNGIGQTIVNLNQHFKRYTYRISSIYYITANNKRSVHKDGKISYSYELTFTSVEGTATLSFSNAAQRDQVYSIIVNLNDMGIPVQNR